MQRRLTAIELAKHDFIKLDPEEQVKKYMAELQSEMTKLIHADPQTQEEKHQVFLLKKHIVNRVLAKARVDKNRKIHIMLRTDFLSPK